MQNYQLIKSEYPYYTYKKSTKKSKGIIFFIHGYAVNSNYHNIFSDKINDYDYYAIEHAGHGITPTRSKKQLSPVSFACEVVDLIKKLKLKNINLIGHSMGGGIAVMVAQIIPDLIKKLIIVTPMNSRGTTKIHNFMFKMNPTHTKQIEPYYKLLLGDFDKNFKLISESEIQRLIDNQNKNKKNYKTLKHNMMSISNLRNLAKNEKDLKVKTLLIVGEKDGCINYKTTIRNFVSKNKNNNNLKIVTFKDVGHLPFFEEKNKYYKTIMNFIDESLL